MCDVQEKGLITAVAYKRGGESLLVGTSANCLLNYDVRGQQLIPLPSELKLVLQQKLNLLPGSITSISPIPDDEVLTLVV